MQRQLNILILVAAAIVAAVAMTSCRSSKKAASSTGRATQKVDYAKMKHDVESRYYSIDAIDRLIDEATRWIGVPYRYGGTEKRGVDCSGLTSQVFLKILDVKMPRSSREQQQWCQHINRDKLRPGDLVFFATGSNPNRVSHVGIYIGNGDMIHASSSRGVIVSNLDEKYYTRTYHSSGRPDVIHRLYAAADTKQKRKDKKKGKDRKAQQPEVVTPNVIGVTPPAAATISLDELLDSKIDSIAGALPAASGALPASPSNLPAGTQSNPQPQIIAEPDTVGAQFFD